MLMARYALIVAGFSALIITAVTGFVIIPALRRLKFGQTIKEIGPKWHSAKNGIPTMGGIMFYIGSVFGVVLGYTVLTMGATNVLGELFGKNMVTLYISVLTSLAFGAVGFLDDYVKVVKKRNLGLRARYKIFAQIFITASFLASLYINGSIKTVVNLPFFGLIEFGVFYYIISFFLIIGVVNAVNLTDGIDGLASSVTFIVMLGFMFIASIMGNVTTALFAAAIAGGCAGFLSWNFYPAKVFMGDTGSMFLGGSVVAIGYAINRPEVIVIIGLLYICEALSVMLQVAYFKITKGKRIFKMSPIHHHFEMCGWSEIKIVLTFSFFTLVCVAVSCIYIYLSI